MFDPALLGGERIRPLRRREYDLLVSNGILVDERVELLRGMLVEMSPQGSAHARIAGWFAQRLGKALDFDTYDVRAHSPFAATDDSEPEPDVFVSMRSNRDEHPSKLLLLIEISSSSLVKDRTIKTEIYAEAGVPEYWIVDLRHDTIDVLTKPTPHGYAHVERMTTGTLVPTRLPDVVIDLADVPWLRPGDDDFKPRRKRTTKRRKR